MRDQKLYLNDILSAIEAIESFVMGMRIAQELKADDKTASAVLRKFEIIGEATKQLPDSLKQQYPDIPWKQMAGFRDKLIHAYFYSFADF